MVAAPAAPVVPAPGAPTALPPAAPAPAAAGKPAANGPVAPYGERTTLGKAFRIALGITNSLLCIMCFTPLAQADMWSNFFWAYDDVIDMKDKLLQGLVIASIFISILLSLYVIITIAASILTAVALTYEKKGLFFAVLGIRAFELFCGFVMYITMYAVSGAIMARTGDTPIRLLSNTGDLETAYNVIYGSYAAGPFVFIRKPVQKNIILVIVLCCSIAFAVLITRFDKPKSSGAGTAPVVVAQ